MLTRTLPVLLSLGLLGACATSPVAPDHPVSDIGPAHVLEGRGVHDEPVIWGGRIIETVNHSDHTELIVASYPLDRADRPRIDRKAGVRFIVIHDGFLEPVDHAPERYLSVLGTTAGIEARAVGEAVRDHPVLEAERIHLWPEDPQRWQDRAGFRIGIGIRL